MSLNTIRTLFNFTRSDALIGLPLGGGVIVFVVH
jgi:hypothetical protein